MQLIYPIGICFLLAFGSLLITDRIKRRNIHMLSAAIAFLFAGVVMLSLSWAIKTPYFHGHGDTIIKLWYVAAVVCSCGVYLSSEPKISGMCLSIATGCVSAIFILFTEHLVIGLDTHASTVTALPGEQYQVLMAWYAALSISHVRQLIWNSRWEREAAARLRWRAALVAYTIVHAGVFLSILSKYTQNLQYNALITLPVVAILAIFVFSYTCRSATIFGFWLFKPSDKKRTAQFCREINALAIKIKSNSPTRETSLQWLTDTAKRLGMISKWAKPNEEILTVISSLSYCKQTDAALCNLLQALPDQRPYLQVLRGPNRGSSFHIVRHR